jgi:hypothetical protein
MTDEILKPKVEEQKTFTIKCTMNVRWVPHFLAALKYMMGLGKMGSSRIVSLYADGDGDFRPNFEWDETLPSDATPIQNENGDHLYDAG